eukprot:Blabericola_migrator_1__9641@NODE_526_length_7839_cov_99_241251_g402_i0_p2_GENE_NODE_526_length_7839_cov_99_241251_g402_i0NODE_526_length_7839_cov_99_241251_g402_i0_p2_ORF_typecomplete_len385_score46_88GST_C_3/PF14497_6/0_00071GST_C/PF00043_25/0_55GST_C_6/PF17171_4/0_83_NODE_526_length_7839_cov_99_241251_g402_i036074761
MQLRPRFLCELEEVLDLNDSVFFLGEEMSWIDPAVYSLLYEDHVYVFEVIKSRLEQMAATAPFEEIRAAEETLNRHTTALEDSYPRLTNFMDMMTKSAGLLKGWLREHRKLWNIPSKGRDEEPENQHIQSEPGPPQYTPSERDIQFSSADRMPYRTTGQSQYGAADRPHYVTVEQDPSRYRSTERSRIQCAYIESGRPQHTGQSLYTSAEQSRQHYSSIESCRQPLPPVEQGRHRYPLTEQGRQQLPPIVQNRQHYSLTEQGRVQPPPTEQDRQHCPPTELGREQLPPTEQGRQQYPPMDRGRHQYSTPEQSRHQYPSMEQSRLRYPPIEQEQDQYMPAKSKRSQSEMEIFADPDLPQTVPSEQAPPKNTSDLLWVDSPCKSIK